MNLEKAKYSALVSGGPAIINHLRYDHVGHVLGVVVQLLGVLRAEDGLVVLEVVLDAVVDVGHLIFNRTEGARTTVTTVRETVSSLTFEMSKTPFLFLKSFSSLPHLLAISSQVSPWYRAARRRHKLEHGRQGGHDVEVLTPLVHALPLLLDVLVQGLDEAVHLAAAAHRVPQELERVRYGDLIEKGKALID